MNEQDRHFVEQAKKVLDESARDLEGSTLARLTKARNLALARRPAGRPQHGRPLAMLGAAASGLVVAGLAVFLTLDPQRPTAGDKALVADLGVLTSEESFEFFQEIEFYEWLSTVDESDAARPDPDQPELGANRASGGQGRGSGHGDAGVSGII